ncbi:MAG: hypothetical protein JNM99_12120 [Verrucomicrobiaceae bacterium]|nr:hypothetical protein [Verrucomicrobiaceae bacterium]
MLAAQSTDFGNTTIFFGSTAINGPTLKLGVSDALPTIAASPSAPPATPP